MHVASPEIFSARTLIPAFSHALSRRLLIWLLAFALPAQALACATTAVRGPAHVHRQAAGAVALGDFRRAPQGVSVERRLFSASPSEHAHAFGLSERHHHDRFDLSVVKTDAAHDLADVDEGTASAASAGAFLALLSASHDAWHAGPRASLPALSRDARFSTRHPAPLDKPPRAA